MVNPMKRAASYLGVPLDEVNQVMEKIVLYLAHEGEDVGFSRFARQLALSPSLPVISENEFLFLEQNRSPRKIKFDKIVRETMGRLWLQLGAERILFFAKDDFDTLQMCFRIGDLEPDKLCKISIKIKESTFFDTFCAKTQGLHVVPEKVSLIRHKFGDEFFRLVPDCGFSMVSFFNDDDFYGVFYIDNRLTHNPVYDHTHPYSKMPFFKCYTHSKSPYKFRIELEFQCSIFSQAWAKNLIDFFR